MEKHISGTMSNELLLKSTTARMLVILKLLIIKQRLSLEIVVIYPFGILEQTKSFNLFKHSTAIKKKSTL